MSPTVCRHASAIVMCGVIASRSVVAEEVFVEPDPGIAAIFESKCIECHRANGPAPFAFTSYQDIRKRARQIDLVVSRKLMPPRLAEQGSPLPAILGHQRLSDVEIAALRNWIARGASELDRPIHVPDELQKEWRLGTPDVIVSLPEPYELSALGNDVIRTFVLPTHVQTDKFVRAIEFKPSNSRIIHHAAFLVDTTGSARMLDAGDEKPGYPAMGNIGLNLVGSFGSWSPADVVAELPAGTARQLPAGADLVAQVHFKPSGKPEQLQMKIGLYFAQPEERVDSPIAGLTLGSSVIDIQPGECMHAVADSFTLPTDTRLLSLAPQAHYICRSIRVWAVNVDNESKPLLHIPDWDFNWQQEFRFAQPIELPAGTRVHVQFVYDNSADNPRNPHIPPRRVIAGHDIDQELALMFLNVVPVDSGQFDALMQSERQRLLERGERERHWRSRLRDESASP